jgi:chromosomal replication initiation ATPase DnaA
VITQLIYISTAQHALPRAELPVILAASRRNNQVAGITGMLLYDGIRFMQALEGVGEAIETTFERIKADFRHRSAVVLSRRRTPAREFGSWDMAFEDNMTAPGATSLIDRVDTMMADVADKNIRELFRSFARVDRYAGA